VVENEKWEIEKKKKWNEKKSGKKKSNE